MLPALFRGELVGQLASFGGQPAAGSFFRVVELLLRDALRLSHNKLNLPFPEGVVNSGVVLGAEAGIEQAQAAVTARLPELIRIEFAPSPQGERARVRWQSRSQ